MFSRLLHVTIVFALALSFGTLASPFKRQVEIETREDGGSNNLTKRFTGTRWSFYDVQTGNQVYCGGFHYNGEAIVALSGSNMNTGLCGKSIRMTYNGVTKYATIVDMCPGCPDRGLDLAQGFFTNFAAASVGIIYGDWDFADSAAPIAAAPETTPTPTPTPTVEPTPATTPTVEPATTPTVTPTPATTPTVEPIPTTTTTTTPAYVPQPKPVVPSPTESTTTTEPSPYTEPYTEPSPPSTTSCSPKAYDSPPAELTTSNSSTESTAAYGAPTTPLTTPLITPSPSPTDNTTSSTSTFTTSATDPALAVPLGSIRTGSATRTFAGVKGIWFMIGSILLTLHLF